MKAQLRPTPAPGDGDSFAPGDDRFRITAFLEATVSSGASSQEVADAVVAGLAGIEEVMVPIVGRRGMVALYRRTVHLARPAHPWLPPLPEGTATALELSDMRGALARQRATDAAAAGACLLLTFHALLSSLIGPSLTERLLRAVWSSFLGAPPTRDTPPS